MTYRAAQAESTCAYKGYNQSEKLQSCYLNMQSETFAPGWQRIQRYVYNTYKQSDKVN